MVESPRPSWALRSLLAAGRKGSVRDLPERPSPSSPIRDVLAQVLKQYGLGSDPRIRRVVAAWREAAGTEFFDKTRVVSVKDGVVTIQVESAPLLQELAVYHKRGLLAALQRAESSVVDLRFLPGARSTTASRSERAAGRPRKKY
jgi:hypothetical protein